MSLSRPGAPRPSSPDSSPAATPPSARPSRVPTPRIPGSRSSGSASTPRSAAPRASAARASAPRAAAPRTSTPGRKRASSPATDRGRASSRPGGAVGPGRSTTTRNRIEPAKPISGMVTSLSWRAIVIVSVVILAAAVVLPSLRAYFRQEEELAALRAEAVAAQDTVDALHGEAARWEDPAFVMAQARERLGFVYPGETPYRVIDPETVVGSGDGSPTPAEVAAAKEEGTWYTRLWDSFGTAGGAAGDGAPDTQPDATGGAGTGGPGTTSP